MSLAASREESMDFGKQLVVNAMVGNAKYLGFFFLFSLLQMLQDLQK